MKHVTCVLLLIGPTFLGCLNSYQQQAPKTLLQAREGHQTELRKKRKDTSPLPQPPNDVPFQLIEYPSPIGPMAALISTTRTASISTSSHSPLQPAIVWVSGGFPPGGMGPAAWQTVSRDNDQSAKAYALAGITIMYPSFRGYGGNPGHREGFYGEVTDLLAAIDFVRGLPYVDEERVFLGGHSTGGTLALLAVASGTTKIRGVISFGPVADPWNYGSHTILSTLDPIERRLRAPIHYLDAIQVPTLIVEGADGNASSLLELKAKSKNPKLVFTTIDEGNHFNILAPLNEVLAQQIADDKKQTPWSFDIEALQKAYTQESSFVFRRKRVGPQLTRRGPSPQPYREEVPPPGVSLVKIDGDVGPLQAWYAAPPKASKNTRVPAVVFAHGGWAFSAVDFEDARPFLEGGAALLVPTWRGENGNPGHFEAYFGELDDLLSTIHWIRKRPEIDPDRIYVFGHSAGGILSGLLALIEDAPVHTTGSINGLYDHTLFDSSDSYLPFDMTLPEAVRLRNMAQNAQQLKHRHVAYIGLEDPIVARGALTALESNAPKDRLYIHTVPGDHNSAVSPAVLAFCREVGLTCPDTPDVPIRTASKEDLEKIVQSFRPTIAEWATELAPYAARVMCNLQACMRIEEADCKATHEKTWLQCISQLAHQLPERISQKEADTIFFKNFTCVVEAVRAKRKSFEPSPRCYTEALNTPPE